MDICKNEGWNYSCLNFFSIFSYTFRIYFIGEPVWLSGLKPLPSAQVMVPGSWDRAPRRALCSVESLLSPFSLPASLPTCDLCLSDK